MRNELVSVALLGLILDSRIHFASVAEVAAPFQESDQLRKEVRGGYVEEFHISVLTEFTHMEAV